jgi:hypothetical protein
MSVSVIGLTRLPMQVNQTAGSAYMTPLLAACHHAALVWDESESVYSHFLSCDGEIKKNLQHGEDELQTKGEEEERPLGKSERGERIPQEPDEST